MPEKQLTIAGYAAGASLAAIAVVYVFAPTFFIDGDANGNVSGKKRGAIGLRNPANDCFINSVLQALAGLGDLRLYLIRETHRRTLDGKEVYKTLVPDPMRSELPLWKIDGLQKGIVTQGLKDVLDALNERPIYKKSIDAGGFVKTLELAFRQRISRQQQDAQEFLQVVAERLCDEYHAGHRARRHEITRQEEQAGPTEELAKTVSNVLENQAVPAEAEASSKPKTVLENTSTATLAPKAATLPDEEEEGFPFEGQSESQIECLTCHFMPKASKTTFCSLTLNVPQVTVTSLSSCFDGMFKTEYIEDFKCEKCRLVHAVEVFQKRLDQSTDEAVRQQVARGIVLLQQAIVTDPEQPPEGVELPDSSLAPKRKIARHQRITTFPKVMAIHLSRSIFDVGRTSMKNSAKVTFPERLPLGSLVDQKKYKLLGVVTHKGSHHSGHYESFRRQNIYAPFSTPNVFDKTGIYNNTPTISTKSTPTISTINTPEFDAVNHSKGMAAVPENQDLLSPQEPSSRISFTSQSSARLSTDKAPTSAPKDSDTASLRSIARSTRSAISHTLSRSSTSRTPTSPSDSLTANETITTNGITIANTSKSGVSFTGLSKSGRKKKSTDRWWRISDEKIKESKTSDVLSMQKEVYLLFYEMERDGDE